MLARRTRLLAIACLGPTMFAVSGCGGDSPTGNSGDALNPLEVQFLVFAYFGVLQLIDVPLLDAGPAAVSGPARTPYAELYDDLIDGTAECSGGGIITIDGLITGEVDEQSGTADLAANATADFDACVVPGETVTLTLNGAPDIDISADMDVTQQALSITIDSDGAVAFSTSDGRSGTCAIDLRVAASASEVAGVSEVVTGSACGSNASQLDISLFD